MTTPPGNGDQGTPRIWVAVFAVAIGAVGGSLGNSLRLSPNLTFALVATFSVALVVYAYISPEGFLRKHRRRRWLTLASVLVAIAMPLVFESARGFETFAKVAILSTVAALVSSVLFIAAFGVPYQGAFIAAAGVLIGVALLLVSVEVLLDRSLIWGVAVLLGGVAVLLVGVAFLLDGWLLGGVAFLLVGVAVLLGGVAFLLDGWLLGGVAFLLVGVAFLLSGVAFLLDGWLPGGAAFLLGGVAFLLGGVAALADSERSRRRLRWLRDYFGERLPARGP